MKKTDSQRLQRFAYKLGFLDGRHYSEEIVRLLVKTNRRLYDEVCRLDLHYPLLDDPFHINVTLKLKRLESIIQDLRKSNRNNSNAIFLNGLLRKKNQKLAQIAQTAKKELKDHLLTHS